MKQHEMQLISMQLDLVPNTELACLELQLAPLRTPAGQKPKTAMYRIALSTEQLRLMIDHMVSAASYRGRIVPPASTLQ